MSTPFADLRSRIRDRIREDAAALVDFASELIRIRSENPPGLAYQECAERIASRYAALGLEVATWDPSGAGPCVTGTFGQGGRALYFSGHYDVVPAQSPTQFEPVLRRGRLHGRGAADMKGGLAAMAFAVRALSAAGFAPSGRIVLVAVPDEETSGPRGTPALIGAGRIERDALGMLTMEPTGGVVWNANRGVISLRVTVRGKAAHVGHHFRGVNAFQGMLRVAALFEELGREVAQRRTSLDIEPEAARRSVLLLGGELSGGHNFNVVPESVSFTVDRRTNPDEEFDLERERLLEVIERARSLGVECDAEIFQEGRSASTPPEGELGRALAESAGQVTGSAVEVALCPGVLETRHYAALGIPALAFGPGHLSLAHAANERVSVERLIECAEIYALTAARLFA